MVGLYDVGEHTISLIAYSGPSAPAYPNFPITEGLSGEAARLRQTIVSNDVSNDPRYLTALENTGSEMIVPIVGLHDQVVGTIDVESDKISAFGESDGADLVACTEFIRTRLF